MVGATPRIRHRHRLDHITSGGGVMSPVDGDGAGGAARDEGEVVLFVRHDGGAGDHVGVSLMCDVVSGVDILHDTAVPGEVVSVIQCDCRKGCVTAGAAAGGAAAAAAATGAGAGAAITSIVSMMSRASRRGRGAIVGVVCFSSHVGMFGWFGGTTTARAEDGSTITFSFCVAQTVQRKWMKRRCKHTAKIIPTHIEQQPHPHSRIQTPRPGTRGMFPSGLHQCKPIVSNGGHHDNCNTHKNRGDHETKRETKGNL